jgi:hypothetical protein
VSKKSGTDDYEDIVKFEPTAIKLVYEDDANALLWDLSHSLIVRILRQGPKTLREIVVKYNEAANEDDTLDEKSDTTIYRYVKALEDVSLVTQAGRRVYLGKTTTEILYARTAKVFEPKALPLSYWQSDRGRALFHRVFSAISKISPDQKVMKKCLSDYILKFERAKEREVKAMLDRIDDESLELITGGDWWEISQTLNYTGIFGVILNQPKILEELLNCFKKTKKE